MTLYERFRLYLPESWADKPEAIMAAVDAIQGGQTLDVCLSERGMTQHLSPEERLELVRVSAKVAATRGKGDDGNSI